VTKQAVLEGCTLLLNINWQMHRVCWCHYPYGNALRLVELNVSGF